METVTKLVDFAVVVREAFVIQRSHALKHSLYTRFKFSFLCGLDLTRVNSYCLSLN